MDFLRIDYLKSGNQRQKRAYEVLTDLAVIAKLERFSPILVGTIPINIDTETSDLDIICCYENKRQFISALVRHFGHEEKFNFTEKIIRNEDAVVARFLTPDFAVEIFGQDKPTYLQNGYLHMIVEHKILIEKGEDFRLQVVNLKKHGYKTEPAFAHLLNLNGDPYDELLMYKTYGE